MIRLLLDNSKSRMVGDIKVTAKMREALKIKSPGYFFSPAWRSRQWDGYTRYVTESGVFNTGMIHEVIDYLKKWKVKYTIEDKREYKPKYLFKRNFGNGFVLRPYQYDAAKSILDNRIEGIKFQRGIIDAATNAGKNIISAAIFQAFPEEKGLFLIDSTEIFDQAVVELGELLPDEVGIVSSRKTDITKRVTVCMVQTLGLRLKRDPKLRRWLEDQYIVLIDECDTTAAKAKTKPILTHCENACIRVGLSGTPLQHKDQTRNKSILSFFGPVTYKITNLDLVEEHGVSAIPDIRIYMGNSHVRHNGDYEKEKWEGIVNNRKRNQKIWRLANKQVKKGPVLILIQYHDHIKQLLKCIPKEMQGVYSIDYAHHKTKNRANKFKRLVDGKTDIFIASMIIKRGKNIHIIRTLINASGGDSQTNVKQIFGRGLRKKGTKTHISMIDFYDVGQYLQRHSKHRIRFYKEEGFEVKELYKKKLKTIKL